MISNKYFLVAIGALLVTGQALGAPSYSQASVKDGYKQAPTKAKESDVQKDVYTPQPLPSKGKESTDSDMMDLENGDDDHQTEGPSEADRSQSITRDSENDGDVGDQNDETREQESSAYDDSPQTDDEKDTGKKQVTDSAEDEEEEEMDDDKKVEIPKAKLNLKDEIEREDDAPNTVDDKPIPHYESHKHKKCDQQKKDTYPQKKPDFEDK